MDIINVFFIISVAVAGTAALTWVPAYRKGVRAGVRKERLRKRNREAIIKNLYPVVVATRQNGKSYYGPDGMRVKDNG